MKYSYFLTLIPTHIEHFSSEISLKSDEKQYTDQKDAKHQHIQGPKALNCKTLFSATQFLQNFSYHT